MHRYVLTDSECMYGFWVGMTWHFHWKLQTRHGLQQTSNQLYKCYNMVFWGCCRVFCRTMRSREPGTLVKQYLLGAVEL